MGDVDLVLVVLGVLLVFMPVWVYSHCSRPALAIAGGRGATFGIALVGSLIASAGGIVTIIGGVTDVPRMLWSISSWTGLAFLLPAMAWLRPRWLVRLVGGPDSLAPVRFILCWYRRSWPDAEQTAASAQEWVAATAKALRGLGDPADAALIDSWLRRLERVARAAVNGPTSLKREGSEMAAALDLVVPVDGLGARLP